MLSDSHSVNVTDHNDVRLAGTYLPNPVSSLVVWLL